jgi:hypothetical protein
MVWYLSWAAFRKVQDCVIEEEEFEDLEDLLVSFRLYFVIVKDSSCNSTMYYLVAINICGIDFQKKKLYPRKKYLPVTKEKSVYAICPCNSKLGSHIQISVGAININFGLFVVWRRQKLNELIKTIWTCLAHACTRLAPRLESSHHSIFCFCEQESC